MLIRMYTEIVVIINLQDKFSVMTKDVGVPLLIDHFLFFKIRTSNSQINTRSKLARRTHARIYNRQLLEFIGSNKRGILEIEQKNIKQ